MLRQLLFFALLLLVSVTPAGAEGAITLRDTGLRGNVVRTDGDRRLAVSDYTAAAPVTIVDVKTRARRMLAAPVNCGLADIHRGTLLWSCGTSPFQSGLTVALSTGQPGALPELGPRAGSAGGDSSVYVAIGTHWAKALQNGYHTSVPIYVNRGSGATREFSRRRRDLAPDLDSPGLTVGLCAGQRRPLVPDASGLSTQLGPLVRAGSIAAATTLSGKGNAPERVQLQRCGRPTQTLRRCPRIACSQPVIVRGWIVWSESVYGSNYRPRGRLVAYHTATRRMIRSPLRPVVLVPLAVGRRLYLQQGQQVLRAGLRLP